jgi:hypothetical protein
MAETDPSVGAADPVAQWGEFLEEFPPEYMVVSRATRSKDPSDV